MYTEKLEMFVQKNEISIEARRIFELLEKSSMSEYELSRCTGISHLILNEVRKDDIRLITRG